jgi:hypothetical protein
VARDNFPADDLKKKRIAVPGTLTSAYLALRLHTPEFEYGVVPFDEIIDAVVKRRLRRRAADPRGAADLPGRRAAKDRRPWRVVEAGDGAAVADGWECDPA